jgi:hypothetical protein
VLRDEDYRVNSRATPESPESLANTQTRSPLPSAPTLLVRDWIPHDQVFIKAAGKVGSASSGWFAALFGAGIVLSPPSHMEVTMRSPLSVDEYNRIHRVVGGVLGQVVRVERACIFFACLGSYLVRKHYNLRARPVAGLLALCIDDTPECVIFGRERGGTISSSENGFHMWVQTDTHIIDFMAPIYAEAFEVPLSALPRKVLQRPLNTESQSLDELRASGDFVTLPNPGLSNRLLEKFIARERNHDLVNVTDAWFGSRHAQQRPTFTMADESGRIFELLLATTFGTGAW